MSKFQSASLLSAATYQSNQRCLGPEIGLEVIKILHHIDVYARKQAKITIEDLQQDFASLSERSEFRQKWYADAAMIDSFLELHADIIAPELHPLIQSFKQRVTGKFICIKYFLECAVFLDVDSQQHYAVLGLTEDFEKIIKQTPPYAVATTLLPFYNMLVWDGIIAPMPLDMPSWLHKDMVQFSKQLRSKNLLIHTLG